jgi:hypothetical protein
MRGVVKTLNVPARAIPTGSEFFVAHGVKGLAVGWQAIEIYPRLSEEYWRPEYAAAWAKLDLMSVIAQRNLVENALLRLDGRRAAREKYATLLEQFETLLAGPEEPCHQFLKANPDLVCMTHDHAWSKVPFGKHVSDFVFVSLAMDTCWWRLRLLTENYFVKTDTHAKLSFMRWARLMIGFATFRTTKQR